MRKLLPFAFLLLPLSATAATDNPFFGDNQNQIMLATGWGMNSFSLIPKPDMPAPFWMVQLSYSQPTTIFRLPARQNFNIFQTIGHGKKYNYQDYVEKFEWDWGSYATQMASITWDIPVIYTKRFYFGAGVGFAIQGKQNNRVGTKFMLPFKIFVGYRFGDDWNVELFTQHFSNGDTGGVANYAYNFFGLGFGYSF